MDPGFPDGNYDVTIEYFSGEEAVDFMVFVNPVSGEGQNFEATGSFSSNQTGASSSFLTISKMGDTYTISRTD